MTRIISRSPSGLRCCAAGALLLSALLHAPAAGAALSLAEAVATAQRYDPWLQASNYRQQSLEAQAVAAGTLPDPMVDLGFANLPTDSFEFDQEAMTQFKVGLVQTFPRGDSRTLSQQRLEVLGNQFPYQREERRAQLAVTVANAWLELWRAQESVRLIEADRKLFENLVDAAQSSYASTAGHTRQQDLIRAQLELTRLEDRLSVLQERRDAARSRLGEWLRPPPAGTGDSGDWTPGLFALPPLAQDLPHIELLHPELFQGGAAPVPAALADLMREHPALLILDNRIDASRLDVELARQKYHPEWKVNASYGYREDGPTGQARPDFFSIGLAFDLPLFTSRRQDKQVQSALADAEASRSDRLLALRGMVADFETRYARLRRLDERQELYRERLLPEMAEQAEASLTAYTRDDGDFAEAVRARIAELNARIEALDIEVARLQTIVGLNYFFTTSGVEAGGAAS
jgi:outer membrane protein TolC